jgi:CRISPR-associated endonuclease/helicase Cas3
MTELAEEVLAAGTALVVVNLKRHASQLWGQLSQQCEYAEHLSTSMCAAHRAETLARVRGRLREKSPTILSPLSASRLASTWTFPDCSGRSPPGFHGSGGWKM